MYIKRYGYRFCCAPIYFSRWHKTWPFLFRCYEQLSKSLTHLLYFGKIRGFRDSDFELVYYFPLTQTSTTNVQIKSWQYCNMTLSFFTTKLQIVASYCEESFQGRECEIQIANKKKHKKGFFFIRTNPSLFQNMFVNFGENRASNKNSKFAIPLPHILPSKETKLKC